MSGTPSMPEDHDRKPVPDPTSLTTENMLREVQHLREMLEREIQTLETSVTRRVEGLDALTESRFVTHRTLLDSQSEKVALALAAADKAVTKAETFNEKRFESLAEKIDDLKAIATLATGRSAGLSSGWGYLVAGVGLIVTLVNLFFFMLSK